MAAADDVILLLLKLGPPTLFASFLVLAFYFSFRIIFGFVQKAGELRERPLVGLGEDRSFIALIGEVALSSGESCDEFLISVNDLWRRSFLCDPPDNLRTLVSTYIVSSDSSDLKAKVSGYALSIRIRHSKLDQARIFKFVVGLTPGPSARSSKTNTIIRAMRENMWTR